MNETTNKQLTLVEAKELSDVFEKTLLELSILNSLYGSSSISDYVRNVFQTSIEELHNFGTLKTLCNLTENHNAERQYDGDDEYDSENRRTEERRNFRIRKDEQLQKYSGDKQFTLKNISLEKKLQILKREEKEIDSSIEKCTENGENTAIRRESEKNYVGKWEKARVEHFKLKFKAEELELQKEILELQAKLETEQIVDKENEQFLDYSINELEKQIEYWERKYKTDITEIDSKLENLIMNIKEKTKTVENIKETYNERQAIIVEHAKNKKQLEEEKKANDYREKMATKIQAWWRGTMVRRRLGHFKNLLGPRKKSIKTPLVSKGKKTKNK